MQIQIKDSNGKLLERGQAWEIMRQHAIKLGVTLEPGYDRGKFIGFTLKPGYVAGKPSHKLRAMRPIYGQDKMRRIHAVCFHGYQFFLKAIFDEYPNTLVHSSAPTCDVAPKGKLVYDGASDFRIKSWELGSVIIYPWANLPYNLACDCMDYNVGGEVNPDDIPEGKHN